jgi:hypothetical protein
MVCKGIKAFFIHRAHSVPFFSLYGTLGKLGNGPRQSPSDSLGTNQFSDNFGPNNSGLKVSPIAYVNLSRNSRHADAAAGVREEIVTQMYLM